MIDKHAQRLRAEQLSQTLAAQGLKKPDLPMPVVRRVPPKATAPGPVTVKVSGPTVKFDCAGQMLEVGDTVATTMDGMVSKLVVGKITGFAPKKVVIEVPCKPGSREARNGLSTVAVSKFPEQLAKIRP